MATIKDIAKLANVSIGTVDRVIHNRGYVSPDTKKRVKQAIKTLNYTPNIYARQLKLAKKYEDVRVIHHPQDLGRSYAIRTGFIEANGDIVIIMDGDYQYEPKEIPKFIKKIISIF